MTGRKVKAPAIWPADGDAAIDGEVVGQILLADIVLVTYTD